ncbi:MAG: hypothetical protein A2Y86_07010 [Candidatus Aminicenantes bacterium RBG_13_62_12]|nr:MAG: hypothetical protein A2Y86_07010 [Candidatus Aminicenantes bacterium RBG_13_62_12]
MNMLFLAIALASVAVGIIASIAVTVYVSKRGIKINYFLYRIMIFKYFKDYRRLTLQEKGKVGPWYYVFSAAMILTLVFVVVGIITR